MLVISGLGRRSQAYLVSCNNNKNQQNKNKNKVGALGIKALATNLDNLNSIQMIHMVEGKRTPKSDSLTSKWAPWHLLQINKYKTKPTTAQKGGSGAVKVPTCSQPNPAPLLEGIPGTHMVEGENPLPVADLRRLHVYHGNVITIITTTIKKNKKKRRWMTWVRTHKVVLWPLHPCASTHLSEQAHTHMHAHMYTH